MSYIPSYNDAKMARINRWMSQMTSIANEMEAAGDMEQTPDLQVLAAHIDSIIADLEFQQSLIIGDGPIVTFKDGKCAVRYAGGQ